MHCDQIQNVQQVNENDAISYLYASTYCIKDALLDAHTQRIEKIKTAAVLFCMFLLYDAKKNLFLFMPSPFQYKLLYIL